MKMLQWCQRRRRLRVVLVEGPLSEGGGLGRFSHGRGERGSREESADTKATISDEKTRCEEGKCFVWRHFLKPMRTEHFTFVVQRSALASGHSRQTKSSNNPLLHSPTRTREWASACVCVCVCALFLGCFMDT